ncbi:MAG: NAD(P)/FAD-dependent oxidoreductase [Verrucomicrobia bacterium]|nr:MAG: NAD(P)/FAD-dependent oxidoreductase [Verrucomicrobiota bacterium]
MSDDAFDVIVIGGGPGGSCAATMLARAGRRVLLLEREVFPRFHIGESLLPYNHAIFEELGLLPALRHAGFPTKRGAQFHLGDGSKGTAFVFRNGRFTRHPEAFQVERSRFDEILLRHAAASGAEVREGFSVRRAANDAEGVEVEGTARDGAAATFRARFLVDATGRDNLTGNRDGVREMNPKLRKLAVFAHFSGVRLDPGGPAGDTVIVRLENKWFWLIPVGDDKVSVGVVMDRDEFAAAKSTPAAVFERWRDAALPVKARLADARRLTEYHVTSDWSYSNRSFHGPRLVRVGDAAGFIDPIFSSGVFLAMHSARIAARAILDALARRTDGSEAFRRYETRMRAAFGIYSEMVGEFYTTPFMELFLEPRNKWDLASAVNAVLAGELEGGWRLRWRMRLFFLLVRLQARRPFMPRIAFAPVP